MLIHRLFKVLRPKSWISKLVSPVPFRLPLSPIMFLMLLYDLLHLHQHLFRYLLLGLFGHKNDPVRYPPKRHSEMPRFISLFLEQPQYWRPPEWVLLLFNWLYHPGPELGVCLEGLLEPLPQTRHFLQHLRIQRLGNLEFFMVDPENIRNFLPYRTKFLLLFLKRMSQN